MNRKEQLLQFLHANPDDPFLQHALALEYVHEGRDPEARDCFEELLRKDPGYVGSYYHLGRLLERLGDHEAAARVYKRGILEAEAAGDRRTLGELRNALEELTADEQ